MTDVRLREVERETAQGLPGARARLLREHVRTGAMDVGRLELAAWLGDEDARLALGEAHYEGFAADLRGATRQEVGSARTDGADLVAWVLGLERWGRQACVRAAIAAVRVGLDAEPHLSEGTLHAAREGLEAAEAWARCPCDAHARAGRGPWADALWGATSTRSPEPRGAVIAAVRAAGWAARAASPARVREALRAELLAWALL